MDLQKDEDFEKAWQENRHIWESTKNLAKAMFYAGQAQAAPDGFEIGRLQDRIVELLDERQELYAQLDADSTEGFVLVPKEPTEEMLIKGNRLALADKGYRYDATSIWETMLEAARGGK